MDPHKNIVYIRHAGEAINKINKYAGSISEAEFMTDTLKQDGAIRQLEIIGEAFRKVKPEFREKYPDVPWEDIIGMRSKLIHDYFGVDLKRVWLVIKNDTPVLKKQIEDILNKNLQA